MNLLKEKDEATTAFLGYIDGHIGAMKKAHDRFKVYTREDRLALEIKADEQGLPSWMANPAKIAHRIKRFEKISSAMEERGFNKDEFLNYILRNTDRDNFRKLDGKQQIDFFHGISEKLFWSRPPSRVIPVITNA